MIDLTLSMTRGRTGLFSIAATQADGTAQDFTDALLTFDALVGSVIIQKTSDGQGITIDDLAGGLATLQIEPEDTLGVPMTGIWQGPCELTMTVGAEVYELGNGSLTVSPNVGD